MVDEESFWLAFKNSVRRTGRSDISVICRDFNARIGTLRPVLHIADHEMKTGFVERTDMVNIDEVINERERILVEVCNAEPFSTT